MQPISVCKKYGYDANSNRKTETKKLGGQIASTFGYKYDGLNRLTETLDTHVNNQQPAPNQTINVSEATGIKGFEYDEVGNRTKEKLQVSTFAITRAANGQGTVSETRGSPTVSPLQTATASFDQLNRLTGLAEADGTQNILTYDNNGNLTQTRRAGVVQQSFEHDPRNQLRRALGAGGSEVARFDYDSDRKRVEKEVYGNSPQRYVYAGDKTVAEYSGASGYETPLAKYQLGANETVRGEFFNQNEGGRYYFNDALGSTTLLAGQINSNYTATSRTDYDSWGVASTTGASNNSIGYTGQRLDSETGLMPLGNGERYYSPTLARFVQQDSFTGSLDLPASLNRFSYAHNNPNKYVDPSGNAVWFIVIGIAIFATTFYTGVTAVEEARTVEKRNEEQIKQGFDPASLPNPTITAVANNIPILPQLFKAGFGQDPIYGEDLSAGWRTANVGLAALEILPFTKGGNKLLGAAGNGGARFINWLGIGGRNADEMLGAAPKAVKLFEESTDELGQGLKNLQGTQPSNKSAEILEQLRNNKALSQARTTADDVSEEIARGLKQADDLDPYRGLAMADDLAREKTASLTLRFEEGMDIAGFRSKVSALQDLAKRGKLSKAKTPVGRDPAVTAGYKDRLIRRAYQRHGQANPDLFKRLRNRIRSMNPDHVQDLQLSGLDSSTNLRMLDEFTNRRLGTQVWQQIRGLRDGTKITDVTAEGLKE